MTIRDRVTAAAETGHDRLYNEAADGYNPYRAAPAAAPRDTSAIRREITIATNPSGNTAAALAERDARLMRLEAELIAAEAAETAAEEADIRNAWPLDITIARRSEWDAWVKAVRPRLASAVRGHEIEIGWTADDLKRAVKAHRI